MLQQLRTTLTSLTDYNMAMAILAIESNEHVYSSNKTGKQTERQKTCKPMQ